MSDLATISKYKLSNYANPIRVWEVDMIDYSPFWNTLKNSSETTYTLRNKHHISNSTIDRLRHNKPLNTTTINDLCRILNCNIQDIATYIPSDDDQIL